MYLLVRKNFPYCGNTRKAQLKDLKEVDWVLHSNICVYIQERSFTFPSSAANASLYILKRTTIHVHMKEVF